MRVALFGATGFVGSYLIDALLAAQHVPVVLVRPGSEAKVQHSDHCITVPGDIDDAAAIAATLRDCDAAIYLIGILREDRAAGITFEALQYEGARRCIDAAKEHGVKRFLLMSANGVCADGTAYQRSKYRAEQYLAQSGLAGTVFRPSVVFGDPRGRMEFCTQLVEQMIEPPIPAPAFFTGVSPGSGGFEMSPVHVEDVAQAFVAALSDERCVGKVFELGGAETLSWPRIIKRIAAAAGRRKLVVPAPAIGVRLACLVFDRFSWFPITRDQLTMLLEGNEVDSRAAFELLGINERGLSAATLTYLTDGGR
ncbi:MAG: NAD(P)H-binding protein [Woeseia sp.]|nr:NAD(P)H-binding protein [Woeseia sp.]MBT8096070.1 NAD(P)H-binding protein [Woeseia sp.]NNE62133.1 NAD(P)H-binding protein [Woeseia sp.]NNL54901.1 NAD(P)H-binding protein [Woeseia sp.]